LVHLSVAGLAKQTTLTPRRIRFQPTTVGDGETEPVCAVAGMAAIM
jgi:hypothetical protein